MFERQDLLVGVFAVQFGFASSEEIQSCMAIGDDGLSFISRLERRGVLDPGQRQKIEEMVSTALQANGGDAEQTLESLGGQQVLDQCFGASDSTSDIQIARSATPEHITLQEGATLAAPDKAPAQDAPPQGVPVLGASQMGISASGAGNAEPFDSALETLAPSQDPRHSSIYEEPDEVTEESEDRYLYLVRSGTMEASTKEEAEIGRGGIGRVLVARDTHLGRDIAIKELLPTAGPGTTAATTGGVVQRFLREARVTGQLEHPAIIPVYEVGRRRDGTLYYTMKLVRGRTLGRALRDCDGLEDRLKLLGHFVSLCQAMAYAHSRGVVHRDIKPANVMVGEFGETVVLDWGLAKVRGKRDIQSDELEKGLTELRVGSAQETVAGDAMGTPAYMSPEQAAGKLGEIDEQSDVWSLGGVLFEILTGRAPFEGRHPFEVLARVMQDDVPPATEVFPGAPPELSAVAARALTRDRSQRTKSALALAEDIEAYQSGRRVGVYEYGSWELAKRFALRHKATLAVAAVASVLLLVGGFQAYHEVAEEKDRALAAEQEALRGKARAQAAERKADERASYARRMLARAFIEKARNAEASNDRHAAQAYAAAALAQEPSHEARGLVLEMDSSRRVNLDWWSRSGAECLSLAHSPTTDEVACATRQGIFVWNVKSGREATRMVGMSWMASVAFSPDGKRLVSGGHDRTIRIWDTATGTQESILRGHTDKVWSVAYSPDGKLIASAGHDTTVRLWNAATGKMIRSFDGHGRKVWSVAFSPDGKRLISGGSDLVARVWNVATGEQVLLLEGHKKAVLTVAWSGDGKVLATSSADWTARLWRASNGSPLGILKGHEKSVIPLLFTPDGGTLITGSSDHTIRLWDVADAAEVGRLTGHQGWVWALTMSRDGRHLVSAGRDITVRVWDLANRRETARLSGHGNDVTAVDFSPDGLTAASGGRDKTVRLWRVATGEELGQLSSHHESVTSVAYAPDGATLAVGSDDNFIRLWDLASRQEVRRLEGHAASISAVAWSPDGKWILSGGADGTARIWPRASDGQAPLILEFGEAAISDVAWSADGQRVAACGLDGAVRVWDRAGHGQARTHTFDRPVRAVDFAPDGEVLALAVGPDVIVMSADLTGRPRKIASHARAVRGLDWGSSGDLMTGSDDGTVRVWDFLSGNEIARLTAHTGGVSAVAWSPDGDRLLTAGYGATVCMWVMAKSGLASTKLKQPDEVRSVAWSLDGRRLATGGAGTAVRVWDPSSAKVVRQLTVRRGPVEALAISGDGTRLAMAGADGEISLFDVDSGRRVLRRESLSGQLYGLGLSRDGKTLAWSDGGVNVLRVEDGKPVDVTGPWSKGDSPVRALALSPDGNVIAAADWGTTVTLWHVAHGRKMAVLNAHPPFLSYLGFSTGGDEVIAGSTDGSLLVWDRSTGEVVGSFDGNGADAIAAAVSADAKTLAAATKDGSIRIWDLGDRRELARFAGHGGAEIRSLAFSKSVDILASGGLDGSIRFWRLAAARQSEQSLLEDALKMAGRALSGVELGPDPEWNVTRFEIFDERG